MDAVCAVLPKPADSGVRLRYEYELFCIKKGRRISPTSSKLSGFIFSYLQYFLICRFLLHLIHTSSLKCICIILILLCFSDHRRIYNLCFYSLSFCPLRLCLCLFLCFRILHMLFLIKLHIHSQIIQLINRSIQMKFH